MAEQPGQAPVASAPPASGWSSPEEAQYRLTPAFNGAAALPAKPPGFFKLVPLVGR